MRDRPSGADLLAIARETLLTELPPVLGDDKRVTGLMIANAMAIVAREVEAGEGPLRRQYAALSAFYGETAASDLDVDALDRELRRLRQRLAADLRASVFRDDSSRLNGAYRLLIDDARARVAESNPKYLDTNEAKRRA